MQDTTKVVNILWTGGWDSTFRLLQLVIIMRRRVQPYYIIDSNRKSIGYEVRAMQHIKKLLLERYPEVKSLLLATKYFEKEDIHQYEEISDAYAKVREKIHIGSQYEFLARFAKQNKLNYLELSLEKARGQLDDTRVLFADMLEKILVRIDDSGSVNFVMNDIFSSHNIYHIFRYFSFPLRELDKVEMEDIARKEGFIELMEHTWFCHKPLKSGKPCGVCTPCVLTKKEGMARRFSFLSMMRYHLRMFLSREQFIEYFPCAYKYLRKTRKLIYNNQ